MNTSDDELEALARAVFAKVHAEDRAVRTRRDAAVQQMLEIVSAMNRIRERLNSVSGAPEPYDTRLVRVEKAADWSTVSMSVGLELSSQARFEVTQLPDGRLRVTKTSTAATLPPPRDSDHKTRDEWREELIAWLGSGFNVQSGNGDDDDDDVA